MWLPVNGVVFMKIRVEEKRSSAAGEASERASSAMGRGGLGRRRGKWGRRRPWEAVLHGR